MVEEKKEISPMQAVNIIAQVASQYKGTAQEHRTIQHAMQIIINALPKEVKKGESK